MLAEEKNITSGERGGGQKGDALLAEEKKNITGGGEGAVGDPLLAEEKLLVGRRAER